MSHWNCNHDHYGCIKSELKQAKCKHEWVQDEHGWWICSICYLTESDKAFRLKQKGAASED